MKGNHRVKEPIIPCCPPVCRSHRAVGKPGVLDGDLSKPFWQTGEWMDDFHDIVLCLSAKRTTQRSLLHIIIARHSNTHPYRFVITLSIKP